MAKKTKRALAPTCELSGNTLTIMPKTGESSFVIVVIDYDKESIVTNVRTLEPILSNDRLIMDINEGLSWAPGHPNDTIFYGLQVCALMAPNLDRSEPWKEKLSCKENGKLSALAIKLPLPPTPATETPAVATPPAVVTPPVPTATMAEEPKVITPPPTLPPTPKADGSEKKERVPPGYVTMVRRLERIKNDLVGVEAKQITPDTSMLRNMGLALNQMRRQVIQLKSLYSKFQGGWDELTKIIDELEQHHSVACANLATEMAKEKPAPTPAVIDTPAPVTTPPVGHAVPPAPPPTPVVEEPKVVPPPPTLAPKPAEEKVGSATAEPSKPAEEKLPAGSFDDHSALAQQELKVAKDEISALQSQIDLIRELAVGTATKVAQTPPAPVVTTSDEVTKLRKELDELRGKLVTPTPPPVVPPTPPAKKGSWYDRDLQWLPLLVVLMIIGAVWFVWQAVLFKKSTVPTATTPPVTDTTPFLSAIQGLQKSVDGLGQRSVIVPPVVTNVSDLTNALLQRVTRDGVGDNNVINIVIGNGNAVGKSNVVIGGCCPTTAKPTDVTATSPRTASVPQEKPVEVKVPNWWELPPTQILDGRLCVPANNCCKSFTDSRWIKAGELLQVIIPDGWNMSCYTPANSDQIECVIDGKLSTKHSGQVKVAADPLQQHEWKLRLVGIQETSLEFTFYRMR
ncbi:MAG: hypothetical protein WCW03_00370 [Candidatus Paceibacterota bacterium]|jgi:hypothetical protein